ncbi:MAG: extracellular solute-binding protein [bacterium]|jgi:multiple sugar transport system substrate-binding protein|nr:extracellular solute-binding protein [bacterium]
MKKALLFMVFGLAFIALVGCQTTTANPSTQVTSSNLTTQSSSGNPGSTTTQSSSSSSTTQSSNSSSTLPTTSSTGSPTTTKPTQSSFWDANGNGIPDWTEQKITLKYATWQHTSADIVTIESLMVNAFMAKYPNITVEFQMMGASSEEWDSNFIAAVESNTLPDVFLVNRLASFLPFNILANISDYYNNDPDTQFLFDSVKELGMYNGKRYAIPTMIYPTMWIVNLDILDAAGVNIPGYDWTYQQMASIAQATTNENTHIMGMYGCSFYNRELPKVLKIAAATSNEELIAAKKWQSFSYDGNQFNFNDPVFLSAMTLLTDAVNGGYCVPGLSAAQLEERYLSSSFEPTYNGKVAMWRDASWSAKNYFSQMLFEWDIYPGPNGVTGGNTDIAGVASTSLHKAAAYQFLKWMTYSEEGLLTRFQLFKDYADQVYISANNYGYPVVDYGIDGFGVNKVWSAIPYGITAPGFVSPEFIESLRNGAYWVNKEVVGWDEADSVAYSYLYQTMIGQTTYAAIMELLQVEVMIAYQNARNTLDQMIRDLK